MMTDTAPMPRSFATRPVELFTRALELFERIPLSFVQLVSRLAVAHVFWNSAQTKLASWPITLQLFAREYNLPLIPPEIAAPLATAAELSGAILLFLGLFTRLGALMLLGVVATIQIFVYPQNWPDHILWGSLLLLLLARGGGVISVDALASRFFRRS
jgi:putative oxidoreductase